ncbi:MAG: 4-hydroxyphenylacetate 3-hydroxylase N-terminal domain-containing protein, partial [Oscillospiraceae bacterium]
MRTQEQYLEKLAGMKHNLYIGGECIGRDDPRVIHASSAIRMTFSLAENPEYEELLTATSHITGKKINRFCHINQTPDDLLKKQELTRKLCSKAGGCIQRCMGCDMMNGLSVTTSHSDLMYETHYNENFLKFLEYFQENDLVGAGSQTDPKGDRIKRPSEQWDPDQYLHVVERREDGVVVCGCKLHNTMAAYADELIVIPTRMMGKEEKDYAIAFAIPADSEGVK